MDRGVLDRMTPAFEHLLRNCVAHGIEDPLERSAAGKDPTGTIRVEARDKSGRLVVTVSDDGRGIDIGKVRRIAIERGLFTAETAAEATDFEVLDILFTPGFSTTTAVTAISGRGVGMDVIKCLAEEQGGTVTLFSVPDRGTRLVLDLPFAPP